MQNGTRKPVRFIKEGKTKSSAWAHFSYIVNCGKMKVTIISQDDYPVRVKIEPTSGAGCEALLETVSRLTTLLFECNIDKSFIISQLEKVNCKACQRAIGKASVKEGQGGVRKYAKSCAHGLAMVLKKFFEEDDSIVNEKVG